MTETGFHIYYTVWLGILGAVMGSFLDCLAWRRIHGESIFKGRSHCAACGHVLGVRDLIPVVSYLSTGGKCRYCGAGIPWDAPAAEIALAAAFSALAWKLELSPELFMWLIFAGLLLLLSLIDAMERLLPDALLAIAAGNRLAFWLFTGHSPAELKAMVIGACSVAVPLLLLVLALDRLWGRETMGGGDIKLLFVMGLYLHWTEMLLLLLTACILGIIGGLLGKSGGRGIPFGPYLAAACIVVRLFGSPLIDWYLGLF